MSNYRTSFPRFLKRSNSRGRQSDGAPNPIDIHVGKRLRMRRRMLGLSLSELAKRLGISYQQIQHYENGTNRVTASRLWDLSQVLKISINFFFEEMDEEQFYATVDMNLAHALDAGEQFAGILLKLAEGACSLDDVMDLLPHD